MLMWKIMVTMALVTFLANLWFYWYYDEANTEDNSQAIKWASLKTLGLISVYAGASVVVYTVFKAVNYRVDLYSIDLTVADLSESNTMYDVEMTHAKVEMHGPIDWIAAVITPFIVLASLAFGACGGAGMAFLPLELIDRYIYRPRLMEPTEYIVAKKVLLEESNEVIKKAKVAYELERDLLLMNPNEQKKISLKQQQLKVRRYEAKKAFIEFEEMQEKFHADENVAESNPIVNYLYLGLGAVFLVVSGTFLFHTFISINGMTGLVETIFILTESYNWLLCLALFFLTLIYMALCVLSGSFKVSQIVSYTIDSHPVKPRKTYTNSFFLHINVCLAGFFGMMLYLVRYTPRYMRYVKFDFFFNRVIVRTHHLHLLYRFKIFEYIFVLAFLISIYVSFFINNSSFILREKVRARLRDIEAEKEKLAKMEKDPATRLMAA